MPPGAVRESRQNLDRQRGRDDEAFGCYQDVLEICRVTGYRAFELDARWLVADIHRRRGEYELANDGYQRALAMTRESGSRNGEFEALHGLGRLHHDTGQPQTSAATMRAHLAALDGH